MYFSEKMKLVDMILSNAKLMYVFPRFGIKLGFGEKTISDICAEIGISVSLFLLVCKVYVNKDYQPTKEELRSINIKELIAYLHNSHTDYQQVQIVNLSNKVLNVAYSCGKSGTILSRFFEEYVTEVKKHFAYEENIVFPYITALAEKGQKQDYNIGIYEENHTDIEEKLEDLKNILVKYVPETDSIAHLEALRELFLFEDDLNRHAQIEDRILVPVALELEKEC